MVMGAELHQGAGPAVHQQQRLLRFFRLAPLARGLRLRLEGVMERNRSQNERME
jgi:hypothetical protein